MVVQSFKAILENRKRKPVHDNEKYLFNKKNHQKKKLHFGEMYIPDEFLEHFTEAKKHESLKYYK